MTTITTHRLRGTETFDEASSSIRAGLFGVLADKAAAGLEFYRSDLFHDAVWINENVHGETTFWWSFRRTGTDISTDETSARAKHDALGGVLYKITLRSERKDPNSDPVAKVDRWEQDGWKRRGTWVADVEWIAGEFH